MLTWTIAVLIAVPLLFALDRLGLWMEERGWIYYRKKKGHAGRLGNALLEPSKQHIVQEKKAVRRHNANPGDPPKPWTDN